MTSIQTTANYDPSTYLIEGGDKGARALFDHRPKCQKLLDKAAMFVREAGCIFSGFLPSCLTSKPNNIYKIYADPVWRDKSAGLYVLVHGLEAHPSEWNERIEMLTKNANSYDIYVPAVPKAGNCSIEEASNPIVAKVLTYTKEFPLQPIFVIAESNGGRIATAIDVRLRKEAPTNPMKISTIAGVHFGTSMIDFTQRHSKLKGLVSPVIAKELAYGSQTARDLIDAVQKVDLKDPPRSYQIYAGTEDWLVPDLALMKLPHRIPAEYQIVHGYGHLTMMDSMVQAQMRAAKTWMSVYQPQASKKPVQKAYVELMEDSIDDKEINSGAYKIKK